MPMVSKNIHPVFHQILKWPDKENFVEVFIDAPLVVCEQRNVKGLYKMARAGEIKRFTGIDAPYEPPQSPDVVIRTDRLGIEDSVRKYLDFILPKKQAKHLTVFFAYLYRGICLYHDRDAG